DADLLEDAAMHQRHGAAAAVLPRPRLAHEAAGGALLRPLRRIVILDRFEGGAEAVAQRLEPVGGALLPRLVVGNCIGGHIGSVGKCSVCRSASPSTSAAASATLSERSPGRIGTRSRASAARCTASGTPAVSRPSSSVSSARKAKR